MIFINKLDKIEIAFEETDGDLEIRTVTEGVEFIKLLMKLNYKTRVNK